MGFQSAREIIERNRSSPGEISQKHKEVTAGRSDKYNTCHWASKALRWGEGSAQQCLWNTASQACCMEYHTEGLLAKPLQPRRKDLAITKTCCPQWALQDVPVLTPSISLKEPPSSSSKGLTFFKQHMLNMWDTGCPEQHHGAYPLARHDCPEQTLSDRENSELAGR